MPFLKKVIAVLVFTSLPSAALALTCTSNVATSGAWTSVGSWTTCGSTIPQTTDTVVISAGDTIDMNTSPTVLGITINNTGVLSVDSNARVLTLTAAAGVPFTLTAGGTFTPGSSTVVVTGDAALTLTSGAITFNNLTLSPTITAARTYAFGAGALTVDGDFLVNPNATSARLLTLNMGANITVAGTTTIQRRNLATAALNSTGSNFDLTTAEMVIATGGTFAPSASTMTITGTSGTLFTHNGTFTAATSNVLYTGDGSATLTSTAAVTLNNLTLSPTITAARTYTLGTGVVTVGGSLDVAPSAASGLNLLVNQGAAMTVTRNATFRRIASATSEWDSTGTNYSLTTSSLTIGAGATYVTNGSTITLNSTNSGTNVPLTVDGTFQPDQSNVVISGNSSLTLTGGSGITLNNLTLSPTMTAGRTYTVGSALTAVNGFFTVSPSATALNLNVNLSAALTIGGLLTITRASTATSNFDTTTSSYTLTVGRLATAAGGTLTAHGSLITINGGGGTLFSNAGSFIHQTSKLRVQTDATATVTSNNVITLFDFEMSPALTGARVYTLGTSSLTVTREFRITPSAGTSQSLTVNLGAITGVTNVLTVLPSGSATAALGTGTSFAVSMWNLFVGTSGTFTANNSTVTINGTSGISITNLGTITPGGSLFAITGNTNLTLTSGTVTLQNLSLSPAITASRVYTFGDSAVSLSSMTMNPSATGAFSLTANAGASLACAGTLGITRSGTATSLFDTTASNFAVTTGLLNIAASNTFNARGSTITFQGVNGTLITNAGTATLSNAVVNVKTDGAITFCATALSIYTVDFTPTLTASRIYTMGAGVLTLADGFLVNPSGGAFVLTVNMGAAINAGRTATVMRSGSATSVLSAVTTFALTASDLIVDTGATFNAYASTVTLNGSSGVLFTKNGTFSPGSSLVDFKPNGAVDLTNGATGFNNVSVTPTLTASRVAQFGAGTTAIAGAFTINPTAGSAFNLQVDLGGPLTVGGIAQVSAAGSASGTLDTTVLDYAFSPARLIVDAGEVVRANGSTITLNTGSGVPLTVNGTFVPGTSTVVISGDAALTVTSGALNLYNFTLSPTITAGRVYTLGAGTLTIANDFTINPTAASAFALTVNMASSMTVTGNVVVTRTTSAISTLSTVSNFALGAARLDVATGGTFNAYASTVTLNGSSGVLFTKNGTFSPGSSLVDFKPDGAVDLTSGATGFNNVSITPTLTVSRVVQFGAGTAAIASAFTINPSAASAFNLEVDLGGAMTVNGITQVSGASSATSTLDTTATSYAFNPARLIVDSGETFRANGSTVTLSALSGVPLTVNGTFVAGTSSVTITGDATLTVTSGAMNLYNFNLAPTITGARIYTLGAGVLTIANNFTINPSAAAQALTVTMASSMTVAGTTTIGRTATATSSLSTTAGNLALETGRLSIGVGGTLTANASTIRLNGPSGTLFTRVGTFTPGTSTVEVLTTADATLNSGTITFNDLVINAPGTVVTAGAAVALVDLTITAGTLDDGGTQIVGNAAGILTIASGAGLEIGSAGTATTFPTLFTTANSRLNGTSTVTYGAGVAQNISGTPTYGHLNLTSPSGSPTKTLLGGINVTGDLFIAGGNTLTTSGSNFPITMWGNYQNDGTFTANTGSVTFRSAGPETLAGNMAGTSDFNTVLFNGAGVFTLGSNLEAAADFTVTAGTVAGTNNITVAGNVTGNGTNGLINMTGGTFTQRVAAAQTFGTNAAGTNVWTFNHLTFSNSSGVDRTVTVNGTGTGQLVINGVLGIGNAGDSNRTTLDNNTNDRTIDVNGDVTISARGTFSKSSASTLTVGGNWVNGGIFTHNNGAVTFDGAVLHALSGSTSFYTLRAVTAGATLQFTAGTTNYAANEVDFQNTLLRSPSNGATWYFTMNGVTQTLINVTVRDSNASGGNELVAASGIDLGNNTNWDFGAPGAITTLSVTQSTTGASIRIQWTSVGDDGANGVINGGEIIIQYTDDSGFVGWNPTAAQPGNVFRINISTSGVAPGTASVATISGLTGGTTYYVRVWTADSTPQYSAISNAANNWATYVVLDLSLSQNTINFGTLSPGSATVITTPIIITNLGNVTQRYQVSIANPADWTVATGAPGTDQFRLTGVFRDSEPASGDFVPASDALSTSATTASATALARDADADTEKGIQVLAGETRKLWFRVELPSISSTLDPQVVNLSAAAIQ